MKTRLAALYATSVACFWGARAGALHIRSSRYTKFNWVLALRYCSDKCRACLLYWEDTNPSMQPVQNVTLQWSRFNVIINTNRPIPLTKTLLLWSNRKWRYIHNIWISRRWRDVQTTEVAAQGDVVTTTEAIEGEESVSTTEAVQYGDAITTVGVTEDEEVITTTVATEEVEEVTTTEAADDVEEEISATTEVTEDEEVVTTI